MQTKNEKLAPETSGPAALVERLRAMRIAMASVLSTQPWREELYSIECALASASPAPACASCAEFERMQGVEQSLRLAEGRVFAAELRATAAEALQQSQSQQIEKAAVDIGITFDMLRAFVELHPDDAEGAIDAAEAQVKAALKGQQP